jgi:hypothetical protein
MTVLQLATSIDNFIVGCKSDGIWNAIKACCILGAWDNLSGALYPLKGTAPTNFNFVSGDYNRKTGLGDASNLSKYLVPNRNRDADPQNNAHACVYIASAHVDNSLSMFIGRSSDLELSATNTNAYTGINVTTWTSTSISGKPLGLYGVTRSDASNETRRVNQTTSTYAKASIAPPAANPEIYRLANNATRYYSTARLAFYSIGESLDLALLDARVNLLMAGIQVGVDGFDADAQAYITNVETADGQPLEFGVKTAINQFVVGCKADGIWNAIKASCILSGARTLAGALVPLAGTAPTNVGPFASGDYDRKTGLVGDGSMKYLNTNRAENADPQNSAHTSVYITSVFSSAQYILFGSDNSSSCGLYRGSNVNTYSRNATAGTSVASSTGFAGASRPTSASFVGRVFGTQTTTALASVTSNTTNFFVFAAAGSSSNRGSGRLAFYSIGESLDLALLDARVTALITAFGVAIP